MIVFEILAAVFGLLQGVLVMFNLRSNWIAYLLQMAFLLAFSLTASLYGDALGSAVYLFLGVFGFLLWGRGRVRRIRSAPLWEKGLYTALIAVGTLIVYLFLRVTDDPLPLLDAFTTVSSFVATYYMLTRKTDAWILWLVNDLAYVAEYWFLPESALYLLSLNLIYTALAVFSYLNWRRIMKQEPACVYFAGKFRLQGDGTLVSRLCADYRARLLGDPSRLAYAADDLTVGRHRYAGPFYCEAASGGDFTSTDCTVVLEAERTAVQRADAFFVVFDENFSVGSVTELGWAIAARKEIRVFYRVCEGSHYSIASDYWFAIADACRRAKRLKVYPYRSDGELDTLLRSALEKL